MNQKRIKEITDYIFLKSSPQKTDLALIFGTRHQEAVDKAFRLNYHGWYSSLKS